MRKALWFAAASLVALACTNAGESRLLNVSEQGIFQGLVYFDVDGNRTISGADDSVKNMVVRLVTLNGRDTVTTATTAVSGRFRSTGVPVGTYKVVLDTTPLADTAKIAQQDSLTVTILPADSAFVLIGVSYPHVSVRAARNPALFPLGRRVFLEGLVLNSPFTFSDTTMHLQDTSGAIRATRVVATSAGAADSVRLRGTISTRAGQRTLDVVTVFGITTSFLPSATVVSTLQASSGVSGTRDAQQVQILAAPVTDTARVNLAGTNYWQLTVNDGSGALLVLLDPAADPTFKFGPPIPPPQPSQPGPGLYTIGQKFRITGVMVPTGTGLWYLKPRGAAEISLTP